MQLQPRYKPGERIGGRYLVHQALLGGMGEVYLCLDLEEMIPLALKTFQQRYLTDVQRLRRAFEQEAATWVALEKHPNIVRCFWLKILDNQPFMCLQWIAGEAGRGADLRSWLRRGPLDLKLALQIAIDIGNGLLHAKAKRPGLVHRDLKPENILMAQGGLAKVTDFGLAQIAQTAGLELGMEAATSAGRQSLVGGGRMVGTPAYMAPEQWRGEATDARTDIYALGVILYELLTGAWPFQVELQPNTAQPWALWLQRMQAAHESSPPPRLPEHFPRVLGDFLAACLAKTPPARPAALAEVVNQLRAVHQAQFDQPPLVRPAPDLFTAGDYINRGNTYQALGLYEQALADFAQAITLDPSLVQVYASRGNTYADLGRQEQALADYDQAITLDPALAQVYANRGNTYRALGRQEQALADYAQAITLDPSLATAYYKRGDTYYTLGRYEQALADYDQALALDPTDAAAYNNRGNTYRALGRQEEELADFAQAITLDPSLATAYYNRAVTYTALGRPEQALADYTQTIALDPSFVKAYYNRGNMYANLGRREEALADYAQAIIHDPADAKAYFNMGVLLANLGRLRDALPYFEQAALLGQPQGAGYAAEIRRKLGIKPEPQEHAAQQAVAAFQQADSLDAIQQAAVRFPMLLQADFVAAMEQVIAHQVPPAQRPAFEQRLAWLRQVAKEQSK